MMQKLKEILQGYTNMFLDKYPNMALRRLAICRGDASLNLKRCELYTDETIVGGLCNPMKTVNGVAGCGCYLPAKTRVVFPETAEGEIIGGCPLKKWNHIPQDTNDSN
jgi:hypothetical protein